MKSKLALLIATLLFFNIILPVRVSASSVQDQSKPIFGLTADQVVEKYNQLSDQQKDQVLRSLGNTSIFANSLFGNIFNSTFGALDDAVKKLGNLFFQANGVIYKLGSSALAWVSRLIDKVFNNNLNDLNISQPVIDDLYRNTYNLVYVSDPFFINGHLPTYITNTSYLSKFSSIFPLPHNCCFTVSNYGKFNCFDVSEISSYNTFSCLVVDLDNHIIRFGTLGLNEPINGGFSVLYFNPASLPSSWPINYKQFNLASGNNWVQYSGLYYDIGYVSFVGNDYLPVLKNFLNTYVVSIDSYVIKLNNIAYQRYIDHSSGSYDVTNNTYYNYIYNIPDQTPLNVTNIVSNTAIYYDPVENLIQYLPDNYNIEQNFSVVNNYYISSGSAISGQAIDVNLVSPGVIDVRVINPEDLTQQEINNVSKDIINNYDVDINASDLTSTITIVKDAAVNNLNDVAPTSGSSIGWVKNMFLVIPSDLMKILLTFLILGIIVCVYHSR